MKSLIEQYGIAIFTLVLMAILIVFAEPIGKIIKSATNTQVTNIDHIGTREIEKETTDVSDFVYACLYNNGNLVIASHEITDKTNVMTDYGKFNMHSTWQFPWTGNYKTPNTTVKTVTIKDVLKLTDCSALFLNCIELEQINNIENLDTSKCKRMVDMFWGCKKLKSLDVSNFDTSKVTDMHGMFSDLNSITYLNVNGFDTKNTTNMNYMFYGCKNLKNLNLSIFDTRNVSSMKMMFYNCENLMSLDLSTFNTLNVTDMTQMFNNTPQLTTIIVGSNWTTTRAEQNSKTTDMFKNCGTDHVTQQ